MSKHCARTFAVHHDKASWWSGASVGRQEGRRITCKGQKTSPPAYHPRTSPSAAAEVPASPPRPSHRPLNHLPRVSAGVPSLICSPQALPLHRRKSVLLGLELPSLHVSVVRVRNTLCPVTALISLGGSPPCGMTLEIHSVSVPFASLPAGKREFVSYS